MLVLAGDGTGHEVAKAGIAGPLVCVLLQLLDWCQCQAETVLGHQQLPGEVVQLHRQMEDVFRHLEREGPPPVTVPGIQAAWKRGDSGTIQEVLGCIDAQPMAQVTLSSCYDCLSWPGKGIFRVEMCICLLWLAVSGMLSTLLALPSVLLSCLWEAGFLEW